MMQRMRGLEIKNSLQFSGLLATLFNNKQRCNNFISSTNNSNIYAYIINNSQ